MARAILATVPCAYILFRAPGGWFVERETGAIPFHYGPHDGSVAQAALLACVEKLGVVPAFLYPVYQETVGLPNGTVHCTAFYSRTNELPPNFGDAPWALRTTEEILAPPTLGLHTVFQDVLRRAVARLPAGA